MGKHKKSTFAEAGRERVFGSMVDEFHNNLHINNNDKRYQGMNLGLNVSKFL